MPNLGIPLSNGMVPNSRCGSHLTPSPHWLSPNDWEIGPPPNHQRNNQRWKIVELRHRRSRMSCWQFLRPDSRCWSTQSAHPQGKPKLLIGPMGSSNQNGGGMSCSGLNARFYRFFRWECIEQTTFTEEGQHPIQTKLGALKPMCVLEQGVLTQQVAVFHN